MNAPDKIPTESVDAFVAKSPAVHLTTRKLDFDKETFSNLSVLSKDSHVDAKKRADAVRAALKTISAEDEDVQKDFFLAFYETLRRYSTVMKVDLSEAEALDLSKLLPMTPLSRKKHAAFLLRQEIGKRFDAFSEDEKKSRIAAGETRQKFVRNRLRAIHTALSIYPDDVIGGLHQTVGFSESTIRFHEAFFTNVASYDNLDGLADEYNLDIPLLIEFAENYPELKLNASKLKRSIGQAEAEWTQNFASNLLSPEEKPVNAQVKKVLDLELKEVDSNGYINPNWFLYDISTYLGIKLYGESKMKYVFGNYFFDAVRRMSERHDLDLKFPDFYNLCQFRLPKTGPNGKPSASADGKQELADIAQHVFEWVVPQDFDFGKLKELASTLRSAVPDLLAVSRRPKEFRHPIKTVAGRQKYSGFFTDAKDFENTSLLLLKPSEKDGECRIRISTDLPQDQFLFLLAQTSRFVWHGDFLDPKQLWTLIYRTYNALSTENVATFDISVFGEQYREFLKQLVWPLSREYHEQFGKPGKARHTALVGLYGTGKSQFLLNLLSKKEFALGKETLHLNANTVNMGILDLVDILSKNASEFKKRLSDIHENTKLPIILIIEDIETIINEEGGKSDVVTQALTNFFEGVGSIPVTLLTTTDYPERLSERLIRPNRIDSIVRFDIPLPESLIDHAFSAHVARNGLAEIFEREWISVSEVEKAFVPRMKDFTTSHVAAFAQSVRHDYDFEKKFDPNYRMTMESLERVFGSILLSTDDIKARQKAIDEWHKKLLDRSGKTSMGFVKR